MDWIDITIHSRGSKDDAPRTWAVDAGPLRLKVTRHIDHPGTWIVICSGFINGVDLKTDDADEAKAKAVQLLRAKLQTILRALDA
jgi:hypothetical protein